MEWAFQVNFGVFWRIREETGILSLSMSLKRPLMLWHRYPYLPLPDPLDAELMCSGSKPPSLGVGFPLSVPMWCSLGASSLGLQPLAFSFWSFSTGGRMMCLDPKHLLNRVALGWAQPQSFLCNSSGRGWCLFGLQLRLMDLLSSWALIYSLQVDGYLGCWQLDEWEVTLR